MSTQTSPGADRALDRSVQRLGARIRDLRKAQGMTIVQLASAADLSHPFISQIERGLARPSMSSLFRIARTLGTDQQTLLAQSVAPDGGRVRRRSEEAAADASGGRVRALVHGADHPFIPMEYAGASTELTDHWTHDEDEFLYVVAGRVHVELDGVAEVLEPADSVYVAGGTPHRWASADGAAYRLLVVKEQRRPEGPSAG
ncbi:helix-turn-helix domain-containing protein [Nocardioides sp. SOB77]|uniref:Helix-turn-helix domain-containing protein n=1 Tax=Nocardioides oceani TaxID=3058369 RepID=A0ABT8FJZ7_9ACTN|nr:helix-turn-helix domain-containing protein [Nocardioides oceani]MDN4175003.1 helix-turn-helix domain-containing protein [Nocardioides oceani]